MEEPIVAATPLVSLEPSINNQDYNNSDPLHLGRSLPRRNSIKPLLKIIEANRHVQLNYCTKMLQLGDTLSERTQLSTKVILVTVLRDLQHFSKTIYRNTSFTFTPFFLVPR